MNVVLGILQMEFAWLIEFLGYRKHYKQHKFVNGIYLLLKGKAHK
jgi:hypothetical protein